MCNSCFVFIKNLNPGTFWTDLVRVVTYDFDTAVDITGICGRNDGGTSLGVRRCLAVDRGAADGHRVYAVDVPVRGAVVEHDASVARREHVYHTSAFPALYKKIKKKKR